MRKLLRSFFIAVLLGGFTIASGWSPLIQIDRCLIIAEDLYNKKDYRSALRVMKKIFTLQKEHNLTLSDEFHFKYAQVALSADSTRIALESVIRYLSATGEEGEFYKEALALLREAEVAEETHSSVEKTGNEIPADSGDEFYNEIIRTEGACEGLPRGSSCWMELINQPECYVWDDYLMEDEIMTWSGECSGGFAQGEGTLIVISLYQYAAYGNKGEGTGHLQNGKRQGYWVERPWDGVVSECSYVDGKKHGQWIMRWSSGGVEEGTYTDGKKQGHWVWREKDGTIVYEGSYVDGKRQGHWTIGIGEGPHPSSPIGAYHEGSYVDGKQQGYWVEREKDGTVSEVFYVDDRKHGQEVIRFSDGFVGGGSYVDGKKHGQWIEGQKMGGNVITKSKGRYVNGQREGIWLMYRRGVCWSIPWIYNKNGVLAPSYYVKENKERCREARLIP